MTYIDLISSYQPLDTSYLAGAVYMLAAMVLLDLFDISLPRGDSVGVAGALSAASVLVLGPSRALLVAVLSALLAHLIRRGVQSPSRLAAIIASRAVALAVSSFALVSMPAGTPPISVYVAVSAVFLIAEIAFAQATAAALTSRPFIRLMRGNIRSQAPVLLAQWSASVLLLLTYGGMVSWSLIPVVALLLLMRQSYALFLDIRETYRTTVEVLVEAAESQDLRRVGHADRSALAARAIAMRIGLSAPAVERISYAALLHDIGELSVGPTSAEGGGARHVNSADVVSGVEFFKSVEPVLRVCDGEVRAGLVNDDDLLAALIVSLASDIDATDRAGVAAAHHVSALDHVAARVSVTTKARVVGAAIELGYRIPAVG